MSYQGTYDPDLYTPGDFANYPVPAAGPGTDYQPGMWWALDPPGDWDGTPTAPGDRTYVDGRARRFGELKAGDYRIGDPPGSDWPLEVTSFVLWQVSSSPWLVNPVPHSGEQLPTGDVNVVVELLHTDTDPNVWTDYTARFVSAFTMAGTNDGSTTPIPAGVMRLELVDEPGSAAVFRPGDPDTSPRVGDVARVGILRRSDWTYQPLATGRVERFLERHDEQPRRVYIDAFGLVMDVVALLTDQSRPREDSVARVEAIMTELGWSWAPVSYPSTPGIELEAQTQGNQDDAWSPVRNELDAIGYANGWRLDADARGQLRYTDYPTDPTGVPLEVTDQQYDGPTTDLGAWPGTAPADPSPGDTYTAGDYGTVPGGGEYQPGDQITYGGGSQRWVIVRPGQLASTDSEFVADMAELLNRAALLTWEGDQITADDTTSQARHGLRSQGYGLPWLVAEPRTLSHLQPAADALVARAANLTHRVRAFALDTNGDPDWTAELAGVDLGRPVTFHRQGDMAAVLPGLVAGVQHSLDRDGWRATVYVSAFPDQRQSQPMEMATTGVSMEMATTGVSMETTRAREHSYA